MVALSDKQKSEVPNTLQLYKGLKDLQTNVDSEQASQFKKTMSGLKPDEVKPFIENLNFFGSYCTLFLGVAADSKS